MKKRILAMVLSMAMVFTMLPATSVKADDDISPTSMERIVSAGDAPVENLARSATAWAAGYNSWWNEEQQGSPMSVKINDGVLATADGFSSWNSYNASGDYPMEVKLIWTEPQTMASMRVMWWADGNVETAGVPWPSGAKVQYKDGEEWKLISTVGVEHGGEDQGINGANNVWNVVNFAAPVTTTELRMLISRVGADPSGVGISEWEVFADNLKENITEARVSGATELAVGQTVEYVGSVAPGTLENAASYEWSVASGSESLIAIQGAANAKNVSVKALAEGEAKLHLKATESGIVKETDYAIHTMSEQDVLDYDVSLLQAPEKVDGEFTLPTVSKNGYAITWQSDNEAIEIDGGVALVIKDTERLKVKLTATVTGKDTLDSDSKRTATKEFTVVVYEKDYLAKDATVTASYIGGWGGVPDLVKDKNDFTGWNGCRDGSQAAIEAPLGETDWIQYNFADKLELTGSTIRYKDDNGGVVVPSSVEFQYYDDNASAWKTVTPDDGWTYAAEKDNEYNFNANIITNQIKLIITNGQTTAGVTAASYIYEWGLLGVKYVKPDLTHLSGLITQAEEMDTTGGDADKVATLTAAVAAAKAVVADKNPTKAQVEKAYRDLRDAIVALGGTIQTDKTALNAAIAAAEELSENAYTPASWKKVADALAAAKALQSNETADQIAIDEAVTVLNSAVAELVEKADKTALESAITKAEGMKANQALYPGASWSALETALTAATATKNNENADQEAVDTALRNLNTEIANVEAYYEGDPSKPDKTALGTAITKAQGLKEHKDDYLEDADWDGLEAALTEAITARDDENADQTAVNTALAKLNTAIANIEAKKKPVTDPTKPDKTALKTAITNAEALKAEKDTYTEASWQKVETALAAAIQVRDDENADKEAIDKAAKDLTDAIAALEKKSSGGINQISFAELTKAIDSVKNYKKADYTDASWKNFDTALKAAQAVLANKSATQTQIDKATADLNRAAKALVKLKVVSTKKVTLGVGETYSVKGKNCTYTISDGKKLTINAKGTVKAKKTGSVIVKAINTNGNVTQYNITIKKAPKKISKVTFNKKAIKKNRVTLKKGKKGTLRVTLPKGTASKITYTSSNKKIATVDSKGVVKAKKKKGTTTITIKTFNKKTKKIKVMVK